MHKDEIPWYENEEEIPPTDLVLDTNVGSSSVIVGSSFSLKENILNMNRRLKELFLFLTSSHDEVPRLIRGLDSRVSNLKNRFDEKFNHDDDMSTEF